MERRKFLSTSAIAATTGLAGCIDAPWGRPNPGDDNNTAPETPSVDPTNFTVADENTFEEWEPDTNCNNGEMESMYNSEISVQSVKSDIEDAYKPIHFDELSADDKELMAIVLSNGGYATCDPPSSFNEFMSMAVEQHAYEQDVGRTIVYLEYEETYYRLYLRKQDQVYAY